MKILIKNKRWNISEEYNIDKILYLLIDRPDNITWYDAFVWRNNKEQLHRDYDLPSTIHNNGHVSWYKNHKSHRENNKPAKIFADGSKYHYMNNELV